MALLNQIVKSPNKNNSVAVSPMDKLSAANPYKNRPYYESAMQGFLSMLGFRTGADAWRENMATQAAEYDAQMALKQYDEEYNLPINQVARMRAAGLNPDLNGGQSISSGEGVDPGQDPSLPMQSTGDEGKLMQFAQGVLSCVSMAAGIAGTIENVRGIQLDNVLKSISGEQQMSEYASKIFPYLLPPNPNDAFMKTPDGMSKTTASERFLFAAEEFAGQMPKRLRDKFLSQVTQFWSSAPGDAESYKVWRDNALAHKDYEIESRTNFSWDGKEMRIIAEEMADLQSRVEKQSLRSKGAESKFNADYYENLSGEGAAAAENAENKANQEKFSIEGELRTAVNNMIQRIKGDSGEDGKDVKKNRKRGNTLGQDILLTTLSMLSLYLSSSGAPSVRRSSTSGIDARTGREYSNHTTTLDF